MKMQMFTKIWKIKHHGEKWGNSVPMLKHERLLLTQRKNITL